MSRHDPTATRRTALTLAGLAGAGGVTLLTGCSADDLSDGGAGTAPAGSTSGAAGTAGDASGQGAEDPDVTLVDRVAGEIARTRAQVLAERRAHPSLTSRLRGLERLHARHAAELGPRTASGRAPAASARTGKVLPRLARTESLLQRRLVEASLEARSGALALLLATMAAGLAQERERL